jgi:hypothetical protein
MGEASYYAFAPSFNGSVKIECREDKITGDAGVLILREVMSRLGVDQFLGQRLIDPRVSSQTTHPFLELVRTSLLLRAQQWHDQDDADSLRADPAFRISVSNRKGVTPLQRAEPGSRTPDGLASQPTLSRLLAGLSTPHSLDVLRQAVFQCAARRLIATRGHRLRYATLDLDSFPIEVHGHQKGSSYNGHYRKRVFHPLIANLAQTGDILGCTLREGQVHTANGALELVLPILDSMERHYCQVADMRIDAGFPSDPFMAGLEKRGTHYTARIKTNNILDRLAEPFLAQLPPSLDGQPPRTWLHELSYRADKWSRARRVVLVVLEEPGQLFPRHFFLLTSWSKREKSSEALLRHYRKRGTAERHIGEFMDAITPTLSSTRRPKSHYRGEEVRHRSTHSADPFATNEAGLLLACIAYNLVHAVRVLMNKQSKKPWGLRRILERVLKVPARIVVHARYATVLLGRPAARYWSRLWPKLARFSWAPIRAG